MNDVIPVRIPQETVNDDLVLVQQWKVTDGQAVQAGQVLVEVETSKSVFEISCPRDGYIRLNVASDQEVPIGKVLCYVGPTLEGVNTCHQTAHMLDAHRDVSKGQRLTEVDRNRIETRGDREQMPDHRVASQVPGAHSAILGNDVSQGVQSTRFSHQALQLLQSSGVSVADFSGHGLVRREDVLRVVTGRASAVDSAASPVAIQTAPGIPAPQSATPFRSAAGVPFRAVPLARSKRVETKVLSWSTQQAIRSSVTVMVPTAGRHQLQESDRDAVEKITANLILQCATLLRQFPRLNACCLEEQVLVYEPVHIGYALDAGHGLKVVVLRDAEQKSVLALLDERQRLIAAYLNESLLPADLLGATFTISDLSGSGVTTFDPLISEGQAGILGISGEFSIGHGQQAFHLVLSFDHRLVEGRAAAMFLNQLKEQVMTFEKSLSASSAPGLSDSESCCSRCGLSVSQAAKRNHFLVSVAGDRNSYSLICTICLQGR